MPENLTYTRFETLSLKNHPDLNERWVQDRIAEDPSILGLGDVVVKDRERMQPRAGRLDILLQDAEASKRYEVEIQLGQTDESHIIRTIEYWDIERKRYPQYDHAAVIIAEDITSRFLNVVGLFNGFIPLVAIQMRAIRINENVSLVFTTVLDEMPLGLVDEDEEIQEVADRAYWERLATKETVAMADALLEIIKTIDPSLGPKYNKFYIGLAENDQPNNFAVFRPQKNGLRLKVRLPRSEEIESSIESAGLDVMDYDKRWGGYRIRLAKGDENKHRKYLTDLLNKAYQESRG